MQLSIIICTYNREKYIKRCLNSFINQSLNKNLWELLIVNNNSTDNTDFLITDFISANTEINTKYIIEKKQGLSVARNTGIKNANGKYIIFIDDDAFVIDQYLENIYQYVSKYTDEIAFGGKIKPYLECKLPNWMSKYLSSLMSTIDLGNHVKLFKKKHYPIGANMGFSKSLIQKTGLFNEQLGRTGTSMLGGEEKDLFIRIRNHKIPIYYFPKMLVHHVIPEKRLQIPFIKNLGINIGISEKIRTKNKNSIAYIERLCLEIYKWIGSIALFFIYLLKLQPSKGVMILKFRFWVSKGLLKGK